MIRVKSIGVLLLVIMSGCQDDQDNVHDLDTSRPAEFGFQTSLHTSLVEEGKLAYAKYCVGCHGEAGDGQGDAAKFFDPKPRDFQQALYKFSSTRSGQLPTDEDLKRTIREGLRGSAMPPFDLLPDRTVDALVAYIKTFSTKWQREPAPPIPMLEDPYRESDKHAQAIRRGEAVYHGFASCWTCHPAYVSEAKLNEHIVAFGGTARDGFRADIKHAVGKADSQGQVIYPPDFLRDFVRSGADVEDLYRVIGAGITGTAMPTWIDSIEFPGENEDDAPIVEQSDIWAMAYYVQDLIKQRPKKLAQGSLEIRERPKTIYLHGEPPKPVDEEEEDIWDDFEEEE